MSRDFTESAREQHDPWLSILDSTDVDLALAFQATDDVDNVPLLRFPGAQTDRNGHYPYAM